MILLLKEIQKFYRDFFANRACLPKTFEERLDIELQTLSRMENHYVSAIWNKTFYFSGRRGRVDFQTS